MLDCYTLSLLSLSLTLSIIIIIIIITISIFNAIEKTTGWEGGFTNKTVWTCLYACYLFTNSFFVYSFFWFFLVKNFYVFLEFAVMFVNLIKIKIKIC